MDVFWAVFLIFAGVYILSRMVSAIEYQKAEKEWIRKETERIDRLNKLYGRD